MSPKISCKPQLQTLSSPVLPLGSVDTNWGPEQTGRECTAVQCTVPVCTVQVYTAVQGGQVWPGVQCDICGEGGADNKNSDSASVALYLARGDLERLISLFNFFEPLFNFDLKLFKQTNSFSSSWLLLIWRTLPNSYVGCLRIWDLILSECARM